MPKSLDDFVAEALHTVSEVEVGQLDSLTDYKLLDVREPEEFAAGHIPGAVNIPRGFLEVKADLAHPKRDASMEDRSQKIVCYCGGGFRSALAAKTLQEMGFEEVVSLKGGWSDYVKGEGAVEV